MVDAADVRQAATGRSDNPEAFQLYLQGKFYGERITQADTDKAIVKAYGVWGEKSMYGRKFMGIERTTVIIDRKGRVARIFPKVKVPGHVQEVEKAIRELE